MREITLFPSATGTGRFVSVRERVRAHVTLPEGSYSVGSSVTAAAGLEDILTAWGLELPPLVDPAYRAAYATWLGGEDIDWGLALGPRGLAAAVAKWRREVIPLVEEIEEGGYAEVLIRGRHVLEALQPIRVSETRVRSLIEAGVPLSSFLPHRGSECPPVKYDHSTKTGRLKVVDGPRVLTLPKEHRGILASRYPGGRIVSVDFVSLEPRLALHAVGRPGSGDAYEEMSQQMGESRARTKIATLSFLYGAASSDGVASDVRAKVREHFRVDRLREVILGCRGRNAYGRPLPVDEDRLLIPHWVQSSAVDVCLLGFSEVVDRLGALADPLFLVHDALFLDVPPENLQGVSAAVAEGVNVSPFGHFAFSLNGLE